MDVIWLKKDIRIHDHGPLAEISHEQHTHPFCIVYLFEPDQLSESSVHGSHIHFINEGLVDLDRTLSCTYGKGDKGCNDDDENDGNGDDDENDGNGDNDDDENGKNEYKFKVLTVCHANAVFTFNSIHKQQRINRILCHEETGHYKSFIRDKTVRKWCRKNNIQIIEFNQTGVTRCLKDRDDFAKGLNSFLMKPLYNEDAPLDVIPVLSSSLVSASTSTSISASSHPLIDNNNAIIKACQDRLVTKLKLHGQLESPIILNNITEIPEEHKLDRIERQKGGETKALQTLQSFLSSRGSFYASGISSPNTSWNSGSRLSPYLTWGHISLRFVIQKIRVKQCYLREEKKQNKRKSSQKKKEEERQNMNTNNGTGIGTNIGIDNGTGTSVNSNTSSPDECWLKSLQAFSSRIHWRSHFIQKLESEPDLEKRDLCPAYQHLRRQENDWNESYYKAWCTGKTGFPFVDASMRCLIRHGWLNFRMRAMLVSFATYNLWLDWKRIAPHLARVFLDYEPGIHYPQLQMQSGTTGINAMRVYNVTKQGKDQDPNGIFIRKYVPELSKVPLKYIFEPSKMPRNIQEKIQVLIRKNDDGSGSSNISNRSYCGSSQSEPNVQYYPEPIVNEQETAKIAKDKVSAVRKKGSTKRLADQVYNKHGSRTNREREMNTPKSKVASTSTNVNVAPLSPKKAKVDEKRQMSIKDMFGNGTTPSAQKVDTTAVGKKSKQSNASHQNKESWNCRACTYLNEKPLRLTCSMCGTLK